MASWWRKNFKGEICWKERWRFRRWFCGLRSHHRSMRTGVHAHRTHIEGRLTWPRGNPITVEAGVSLWGLGSARDPAWAEEIERCQRYLAAIVSFCTCSHPWTHTYADSQTHTYIAHSYPSPKEYRQEEILLVDKMETKIGEGVQRWRHQ